MSKRTFVDGKMQPLARKPKAAPVQTVTVRQRPLWQFAVLRTEDDACQSFQQVAANSGPEAEQASLHICVQLGLAQGRIFYPSRPWRLTDETVWDRVLTDA